MGENFVVAYPKVVQHDGQVINEDACLFFLGDVQAILWSKVGGNPLEPLAGIVK